MEQNTSAALVPIAWEAIVILILQIKGILLSRKHKVPSSFLPYLFLNRLEDKPSEFAIYVLMGNYSTQGYTNLKFNKNVLKRRPDSNRYIYHLDNVFTY